MKEIHEPLASLSSYLTASFVINFKELILRIKNNKSRFLIVIIIGLILMLLNTLIGLVYYLLLFILVIASFVSEFISSYKLFLLQKKICPEGIIIEIDDLGFKKKTKDGREWRRIFWTDISLIFYNNKIHNITLYDNKNQEYHFFFTHKMSPANTQSLKGMIEEKTMSVSTI